MDIIEVKRKRWNLDRAIEKLLKEFSEATTMHIVSIDVDDSEKADRNDYKVFTEVEL